MSKILDDYGIERDPRFAQCFKEAAAALGVFVLHMAFVLGTVYVLWFHADRGLRVFGLPAYLFWGVFVGSLLLIAAVWALTRLYYRDMSLDDDI